MEWINLDKHNKIKYMDGLLDFLDLDKIQTRFILWIFYRFIIILD